MLLQLNPGEGALLRRGALLATNMLVLVEYFRMLLCRHNIRNTGQMKPTPYDKENGFLLLLIPSSQQYAQISELQQITQQCNFMRT